MGRTALNSHAKGKKHISRLEHLSKSSGSTLDGYVLSSHPSASASSSTPMSSTHLCDTPVSASSCASLDKSVTRVEHLKAETLWCLKVVHSNYSYRSANDTCQLFSMMFPDSPIAQKFTCQETKAMYITCFGIAPYVFGLLVNKLKDVDYYTLIFDESMNKDLQKKQVDYLVRFWDETQGQVSTRYFTSDFIGHGRADDLIQSISAKIGQTVGLKNLLQLGMDGPNVNFAIHDKLDENLHDLFDHHLLHCGSCGLHVVHNSFKRGFLATEWKVDSFFRSLHICFNDTPARRE
jgi:hypothetical protein